MNHRFAVFITVSLLAHLALLLVINAPPPPGIGGNAAALQITVTNRSTPGDTARSTVATAREPVPPAPPRPAPTPATRTHPSHAVLSADRSMPRVMAKVAPTPAAQVEQKPASHSVATAANASKKISAALKNQLVKNFNYPWLARKRGWQGQVTLSLHIEGNGDLTEWKIAQTSGYQLLDRSALDSARRINRLPEAVGLLNGATLELLVPVHYQLRDS